MKRFLLFILLFLSLSANTDEQDFEFAVVGDRTGGAVGNVFNEIIGEVKLLNPDFVINVGDLIEGYVEDISIINAQWDSVLNIIKDLPSKFYFVPGNHDIQNNQDREVFEKRTNCKRYYSFDYKNTHFIILDNSMTQWTMPQQMDEEQINWLKADLEKNKNAENIFVFFHVPTWYNSFQNNIPDPLVDLFKNYGVGIVFSGHNHSYTYLNQNNIEFIVVGSSGGGMDDNDFAKGNFYQFLQVSVKAKKHKIAVVKKGNVLPCDIVTFEDQQLIKKVVEEAVKLSSCSIKEGAKKIAQNFTVTIENLGSDSILNFLRWHYEPARYKITPAESRLDIGLKEKREYKFNVRINDGSEIFPTPQFILVYPFKSGKNCTLKNGLAIRRIAQVKRIKSPPILDGRLDDEVWKKMKPITNLGSYDGLSSSPVEKTEIYLAYDNDNLYIAARCFEKDFSRLKALAIEHDGATYMDDNIWFFIDSNLDQQTYYQVIINSKGIAFDRLCSLIEGKGTKDIKWNGPWEIKSGREDDFWTLEIKIPKKGLEPFNKKEWGFNFRRLQIGVNDAGYWSIPFGHDPKNFGIIVFE